jgi:hypothetical protein
VDTLRVREDILLFILCRWRGYTEGTLWCYVLYCVRVGGVDILRVRKDVMFCSVFISGRGYTEGT